VLAPGLARARGGAERGGPGRAGADSLAVGQPADLVVFDPMARWTVTEATLASRGKNTPLLGRSLPGEVLLTVANGRLAFEAPLA
jgi:dihydroorotase